MDGGDYPLLVDFGADPWPDELALVGLILSCLTLGCPNFRLR